MRNSVLRSQVARVIREIAAEYVKEAMEITIEIARDEKAFNSDRLRAVQIIFERAAGRPTQEIIMDGEVNDELRARMLQAHEAAARVLNALPSPGMGPLMGSSAEIIDLHPEKVVTRRPRQRLLIDDSGNEPKIKLA